MANKLHTISTCYNVVTTYFNGKLGHFNKTSAEIHQEFKNLHIHIVRLSQN